MNIIIKYFSIVLFLVLVTQANGQKVLEKGTVSFISSKNVYVKFNFTKDINVGDSLFINQGRRIIPVLKVENKSSSSVVCVPIGTIKLKVKDVVTAQVVKKKLKLEDEIKEENIPFSEEEPVISNDLVVKPDEEEPIEEVLFKEKIKGRFSAATYNNIHEQGNLTRMRYAFSFRGYNLKNSKWSTESYITFRHNLNDSISLVDALKVYSLNVKYDFNKNTSLLLGRKINQKFSSMGAVDGLQFEKGWGNFSAGLIAGTRPDFQDYSFNPNLLQFGGYVSYQSDNPNTYSQTTVGIIEQMNKMNTDRRFVYLQHSSTLAKNLNFFGSAEIDLYENINNEIKNTAQLTNLYVSLRYRLNRRFRIWAAYDTRKNIIYYESYKSFIDQLIDDETRQGLRVGFSHRITKQMSWGTNGSMRFQNSQANPSRSASGYFTYNRVPFIKARATLRASFLQTDFLDSQIFGARLSKEIVKRKINGDLYYRWVDYKYKISDRVLHQHIAGASVSFRIQKQLSLYLFYEGILDNTNQMYHRVNAKIIKRF